MRCAILVPSWALRFAFLCLGSLVLAQTGRVPAQDGSGQSFPVRIEVAANQPQGALRSIWRFFGADEPNYATMPHGRKLLGELGGLAPGQVYFRAHNLLCSGDGTPALKWGSTGVYREDAPGRPRYDWTILDRIFGAYLENGVRPYVQIGFMPQDLSVRPEPYQHRWRPGAPYEEIYTGWAYPPKDYAQWAELVYQWARHCVETYGQAEVETWYWQTWNEANIGYWQGTPEEFRKLHDYAIDAVRRALPTARVGGPDVAGSGGRFMRDFLDHCLHGPNHATGQPGTPLDFVSFHAKGAPRFVDGHVQMGIAHQLRVIDDGFRIVASYPELKDTPVVIGESDPEGCAACQGPQLAYRNGTMYSSYTAASFARKHDLADRHGVRFEGALTWAFEFENQPLFAGFRALATGGIDKPVLNVFRMFSRMGGQRLKAKSDGAVALDELLKDGVRQRPDVAALASLQEDRLCVMVWHYHDDDLAGPRADVRLDLTGLPPDKKAARLHHYRIDQEHSNAYSAWQRMGSPPVPNPEQYAALEKAGQLALLDSPRQFEVAAGRVSLQFDLPRQAVSLLVVDLAQAAPTAQAETCFLFSYFVGNGEDGLHLAWSQDGYQWTPLAQGRSFLKPEVGESKLMRDPCLLRGPDGLFHMVWTTSWQGKTIGYASSRDLVQWSPQQAIPVMAHEPQARNCWAPEIVFNPAKNHFLIFWATTIPGRFPETDGQGDNQYNHRMYATTTRDFKTFTPTRLFYDPGFNVIDATLLPAGDRFALIIKDETLQPVRKHLRLAWSDEMEGPFTELSPPFTQHWVEGPSALRIGDECVVYFDAYRDHHYGAVRSRDLKQWEDATPLLSFPKNARHGTVLAVPRSVVAQLLSTSFP